LKEFLMAKSIALGDHFENFVAEQVSHGRFNNESEVVRAGLRMLEEHELKLKELRALIDAGDRDVAAGRTTTVNDPKAFAADIAARGRARAAGKKVRA
jgi:antitoxin ParD1/3/4